MFQSEMAGHRFDPGRPPARAYDQYLKAYSVAMLPRKERTNVSYGGKSMFSPVRIDIWKDIE